MSKRKSLKLKSSKSKESIDIEYITSFEKEAMQKQVDNIFSILKSKHNKKSPTNEKSPTNKNNNFLKTIKDDFSKIGLELVEVFPKIEIKDIPPMELSKREEYINEKIKTIVIDKEHPKLDYELHNSDFQPVFTTLSFSTDSSDYESISDEKGDEDGEDEEENSEDVSTQSYDPDEESYSVDLDEDNQKDREDIEDLDVNSEEDASREKINLDVDFTPIKSVENVNELNEDDIIEYSEGSENSSSISSEGDIEDLSEELVRELEERLINNTNVLNAAGKLKLKNSNFASKISDFIKTVTSSSKTSTPVDTSTKKILSNTTSKKTLSNTSNNSKKVVPNTISKKNTASAKPIRPPTPTIPLPSPPSKKSPYASPVVSLPKVTVKESDINKTINKKTSSTEVTNVPKVPTFNKISNKESIPTKPNSNPKRKNMTPKKENPASNKESGSNPKRKNMTPKKENSVSQTPNSESNKEFNKEFHDQIKLLVNPNLNLNEKEQENLMRNFEKFHMDIIFDTLSLIKSPWIRIMHKEKKETIALFLEAWKIVPEYEKRDIVEQVEKLMLTYTKFTNENRRNISEFTNFLKNVPLMTKEDKIRNEFRSFFFFEDNTKFTDVSMGFVAGQKVYIYNQIDAETYSFDSNDENFKNELLSSRNMREKCALEKYYCAKSNFSYKITVKTNSDILHTIYNVIMDHFSSIPLETVEFYYTLIDQVKVVYVANII